jgi:prevent-host-death family protein
MLLGRGMMRSALLMRTADLPRPPATLMYMSTVGVAELRQNMSKYLRLVGRGERLVVTERNKPVAELGPPPSTGKALDRLLPKGA